MSKLSRVYQQIFGSTSLINQISQFGSLAASTPTYSTDPAVIQALSKWLLGWNSAVLGNNSPAIEDMNAVCYVFAYQLAYIFQNGIPEYNSLTAYYIGSLVNSGGIIFVSRTDNNTGNALTDTTKWNQYGNLVRAISSSETLTNVDQVILSDSSLGNITITLPPIDNGMGQNVRIKDIGLSGNTTTVKAHGSDVIDLQNVYPTALHKYDSVNIVGDGFQWWVM